MRSSSCNGKGNRGEPTGTTGHGVLAALWWALLAVAASTAVATAQE